MGERAKTPYFAKGARVEVNIGMGETVFWKVPTGKAAIQGRGGVVLTFPAAGIDSTEDLVLKYEATAVRADDGTEVAKENIPTDFFRGSLYAKRAYEHLFPAEKLPEGVPCRFVVRASDCFDKWSEPITSQPIAFKSYEV